jgi:hypothetical protein
MTGRLPLGAGGPPAGGAPSTNRGPGGGSYGGTLSVIFCIYMGLWAQFCIGYWIPIFCTHRGEGTQEPTRIVNVYFL